MDPFATPTDVEGRWRPLTPIEVEVVPNLLADAAAIIRREYRTIDARIADGQLDAALARLVNVNAVLRVLRNPTGILQETTGPFSVTYDRAAASSAMRLTPDEKDLLSPPRRSRVGSIRLRPGLW